MHRRRSRIAASGDRGSLVLFSLFLISLLTAVTSATLTRSTTDLLASRQVATQAQNFHWAESGLDCAISALRTDPDPDTTGLTPTDLATMGTACSCNTAQVPAPCPVVGASRTVSIALTPGGQPFNGTRYEIGSQWTSQSRTTTQRAIVLRRITSPFQHAAYAIGTDPVVGISFDSGGVADSYNSALGAYDQDLTSESPTYGWDNKSQISGAGPWTCVKGCNAEVRTNSSATGTNGAILIGDFFSPATKVIGPASAPNGDTTIGMDARIVGTQAAKPAQLFSGAVSPWAPTGSCTALGIVFVDPASAVPDVATCSKSGSEITCTGACYTASSLTVTNTAALGFPNLSTLYVSPAGVGSGNIDITTAGKLKVGQGTVRAGVVTVDGASSEFQVTNTLPSAWAHLYANQFLIRNQAVMKRADNRPPWLRLYATSTLTSAVEQGGKLYGALYSPQGDVSIRGVNVTNAEVYGAVLCKKCTVVDGAMLHFDEAVKTANLFWPAWMRAEVTVLAQGTNITYVVSSVCGDGICDVSEDEFLCPGDCGGACAGRPRPCYAIM